MHRTCQLSKRTCGPIRIPLNARRSKRSYSHRGPFDSKHSRMDNRNVSPGRSPYISREEESANAIERELTMSYRTILSLAATAILTTAGMSIVSTDALARAGARVGMNHARVGAVAHRQVYRGAYTNRGIYRGAYARPGVAVGVGAAALGAAAAASAYNYNSGYAPTYYGDTGYYQQPYGYQPWSGSGSSSYPYTSPWWAR